MPDPSTRTIAFKRIVDPSDPDPQNPTNYIDVPVTVGVVLGDGKSSQRLIRTYDNTKNNTVRATWTDTVNNKSTDGQKITEDDSNTVDVERVISVQVSNQSQLEFHYFNTGDPAPLPPPSDPSYDPTQGHYRSHVLRYNKDNVNDPNSTPWVDVEVADAVRVGGNKRERNDAANLPGVGQQSFIWLENDFGDNTFSDPTDPYNPAWADQNFYQTKNWDFAGTLPLDTNGNPDPVRLDPFTNIANINWNAGLAVEFFDQAT